MDNIQNLSNQIYKHEVKLDKIELTLEKFDSKQDRMADNLGAIAVSMQKQELLLEKITNLEVNTRNSFDRVHKRIDEEVKVGTERRLELENRVKILDPVIALFTYPTIAVLVIIGAYAFSIKEVRDDVRDLIIKLFL